MSVPISLRGLALAGLSLLAPAAALAAAPTQLAFTTSPQTLAVGACSAATRVQRQDSASQPSRPRYSTVVSLSGTGLGFYSNSTCTTTISSVTIPSRSSLATFYFKGSTAGQLTLRASSGTLIAANQQATINSPAPAPSPSPTPTASTGTNLIPDGGFESGTSGYWAQSSTVDSATRTTTNPIAGTGSLRVSLTQWGSNVWWQKDVRGTSLNQGTSLTVKATVRGETVASNSPMLVCALVHYSDGTPSQACSPANLASGETRSYTSTLTLDPNRTINNLNVRLHLDGPTPAVYTVDTTSLELAQAGPTPAPSPTPTPTVTASPTPTPSPTPTATLTGTPVNLSAVWANDGGDKVTRDELRARASATAVQNRVWNGGKISVFGAKNEVVSFNLVLEAAARAATGVSVSFDRLTGPGGSVIDSTPTTTSGVFNWTNRNIELFYVRYLPIKGLSLLSYDTYDERHIPKRFRRPWSGEGYASGTWNDRPDHDKYYPEIAAPMELHPTFNIALGQNQSVWADVYVPKDVMAGVYTGTVTVTEEGRLSYQIPVELTVRNFALPDNPTSKTMVYLGYGDIGRRYTGTTYPSSGTSQATLLKTVRDRHFLLAHRHKISLIDSNDGPDSWSSNAPRPEWAPRLNGSLFTATNGYDGPGVGTPNDVFSIGTYGSWSWRNGTEADMHARTNSWESWFAANAPGTDRFLYLIDESSDYPLIEKWAQWMDRNTGIGRNLASFATISLTSRVAYTPSLDLSASWFAVADTTSWQNAANTVTNAGKRFFMYNGKRPANGSFATEDDGVALRELAWAQYKKNVSRWFFWESTYYNDFQGGRGQTNVFQNAHTFGGLSGTNSVTGETGWNHSNGDGVLFYPGIDTVYPSESYGLQGPIASLRLKHWRRGIQDVDYLALAKAINPTRVSQIVSTAVPKALWEFGIDDPGDPTWNRTDIGWSTDPNIWESYRAELATIIESGTP